MALTSSEFESTVGRASRCKPVAATITLLLLLLAACGDDVDYFVLGGDYDPRFLDSGALDGSLQNPMDGGGSGGLYDAELPDGAYFLPDGRLVTDFLADEDAGGTPELDINTCSVAEDAAYEYNVPLLESGFALTPGPLDFGLAFVRQGSQSPFRIDTAIVLASSGAPTPTTVLEGSQQIGELALLSSIDGWLMAYTDNSANKSELYAAGLSDTLALDPGRPIERLTNNDAIEARPALADVAGRPMGAWIERGSGGSSLRTRLLSDASSREVVAAAAGHQPMELSLAQMGTEGAALAWAEEQGQKGVWLLRIDADGAAIGEPLLMSSEAAPWSSVALATRTRDGGATVYSLGVAQVSSEVRFRRLDRDGSFRTDEVKVIGKPLQARDAGLAPLGGGFVVAYRALPDGTAITQPEIRMLFISRDGALAKDNAGRPISFPVAPAAQDGSPIQVKVSVDGHVMMAFVDGGAGGEHMLRIIRRRLDCGG
ncbi:MAG: hypothetical protein OEZ06_11945 [Myxococcales bacterium]|nr:hypothetical protein [Myxococcales bacterium]